MRKSLFLTAALAALAAGSAYAQPASSPGLGGQAPSPPAAASAVSGGRAMPHDRAHRPGHAHRHAEGGPRHRDRAERGPRRDRDGEGRPGRRERAAAMGAGAGAGTAMGGADDAADLLRQAEAAAQRGPTGRAIDLLEQAETRILTRSTVAGTEGTPMRGGPVEHLGLAREALARRDRTTAQREIGLALQDLRAPAADGRRAEGPAPRGETMGHAAPMPHAHAAPPRPGAMAPPPMPAAGTTAPRADMGPAGATMSRADLLLAQAPPPGGSVGGPMPGGAPATGPSGNLGNPQSPSPSTSMPEGPNPTAASPMAPGAGRPAGSPGMSGQAPGAGTGAGQSQTGTSR